MSLTFEEIIEQLQDRGGMEDVIAALRAKKEALGPDATEEEIMAGIKEVLVSFKNEDKTPLQTAAESVREVMARKKWKYSESELRSDIIKFELNFNCDNCRIKMRVYVETNPNVCRIDALLPIVADPIYEYPLCKLLVKENYSRRYGAFQYDESDGELTYRYSFSTQCGLFGEVFEKAFLAVLNTADDCFPQIRKYAVGKFTNSETKDILEKLNVLITDIDA